MISYSKLLSSNTFFNNLNQDILRKQPLCYSSCMCSHCSWDASKAVGRPTLHVVATRRNLCSVSHFGLVNALDESVKM
jgi:hypothetical protein